MQINYITKLAYQGKNQGELQVEKDSNGYKSDEWLTFLQAKQSGLKIKKGSKGVAIFKGFGEITEKKDDGKTKTSSVPLGTAWVFNLDLTEPFVPEKVN